MAEATELYLFTPALSAVYPHLNEPDTYKDKTEYKVKLRGNINDPAVKAFMEEQKAAAKSLGFAKIGPAVNLPMKRLLDEDGNQTDEVQIILKSKFQPLFVKPSGREFGKGEAIPQIGDGSILVGKIKCKAYEKGVAGYMEAIQILKVVEGGQARGGGSGGGFAASSSYSDDDVVALPGASGFKAATNPGGGDAAEDDDGGLEV